MTTDHRTCPPLTQVRRLPEKQSHNRAALTEILQAGVIAHIGVVRQGFPTVIPVGYAPWREGIVFHGSHASQLFRSLRQGSPTCATVTLLDSLIAARSAFESSMGYRCAMIFGTATLITGSDKAEALQAFTEHLLPGRWPDIRPPSAQEDKATDLLYLPSTQWSVKVSDGFAEDTPTDREQRAGTWAGVVPLQVHPAPAISDDLAAEVPVPAYVQSWGQWPSTFQPQGTVEP